MTRTTEKRPTPTPVLAGGRAVTDALVLAAGSGSRLRRDVPKPALPLLGVPLLARTLFTLQEAGITDAYVVVGHQQERVRRSVEEIDRLELRVHWIHNERWEETNGLSVLAGRELLDGPFVLVMSDHLFDASIVDLLREEGVDPEGVRLAVDHDVESVTDLEDATKVEVEGDRILSIGKEIERYDAIDTGVFLATPALFEALAETAMVEGISPTLSDGVRRLAESGRARVVDIGDRMWHDIDTPRDVEEAEEKLIDGLRKPTDGPIARFLNRPFSIALSRRLVRTSVTPNQISVFTLLVGLLAAGLVATGRYLEAAVGGVLFHLASVLDGTDGEVAKLTFRSSLTGEWVDTVCDYVSYAAFMGGMLVGVYRGPLPDFYVWTGLTALAAGSLSMVLICLYLLRRRGSGSALAVDYGFDAEGSAVERTLHHLWHRFLWYMGKRDFFAFAAMVLALAGLLRIGVVILGLTLTFFLLPLTLKINLDLGRARSARARAEGAPDWRPRLRLLGDGDWAVEDERERLSESATG